MEAIYMLTILLWTKSEVDYNYELDISPHYIGSTMYRELDSCYNALYDIKIILKEYKDVPLLTIGKVPLDDVGRYSASCYRVDRKKP